MKGRLFIVFALAIGLALLLTWVVAAQGARMRGSVRSAQHIVSLDYTESYPSSQNAASLGRTSDITFTPAFTTYLPAIFKNWVGCSTIPTLTSPTNGSNLSTLIPLFQWDAGNDPNATSLYLQVAQDPGFTQQVRFLSTSVMGVYEFRFASNFDPATTYYWRAWLLCGSTAGSYSDVWSFTTGSGGTILPAPALVAPGNGSAVPTTTVTLQWSPVSGTVEYLVVWRKVGQSSRMSWVSGTQRTISGLSANTTYEWWVSARNDYAIGAASETWQFTTPAGSLFTSLQNSNHDSAVEDGSAITVFEGGGSK